EPVSPACLQSGRSKCGASASGEPREHSARRNGFRHFQINLSREPEIEQWQFFREPFDAIELDDVGAAEDAGQIEIAAGVEPDAEQVYALVLKREHGASGVLDEIAPVRDVDVGRLAVADQKQKVGVRLARG